MDDMHGRHEEWDKAEADTTSDQAENKYPQLSLRRKITLHANSHTVVLAEWASSNLREVTPVDNLGHGPGLLLNNHLLLLLTLH